jgi:hypothetical protein
MSLTATELTQVMGLGNYVGEVRQGPDAQLYEWVEGADGVGNPIGFWRGLKRLARRALPLTRFIPGYGTAIYAAGKAAQRAGLLGTDSTGKVAQGPDGQLYEWVEGVDGLGNPLGFWKSLTRAAGGVLRNIPGVSRITGLTKGFCQALPQLQPCVQQIPGAQRPLQMGTQVCNALRRVGLAGVGDEIMEGPDGQLYEVVESIGEAGTVRRSLRPVWLKIPAAIGPRRVRRGVRPPVSAAPTVRAVRPGAPMRRVVRAPMARPVARFR